MSLVTRLCAAVAAAVTLAATAACGSDEEAPPAPVQVGIVVTERTADQQLPAVTAAADLFARHGVVATITYLPPADALTALREGRAQLAVLGAPDAQAAALAGTPVRLVAQWQDAADLVLMGRPGQAGGAALKDRRVAVGAERGVTGLLALLAGRESGVRVRPVADPDPGAALRAGRVDAAVVPGLARAGLEASRPGAAVLRDFAQARGSRPLGLVGLDSWLRAHRDEVVSVIRALDAGRLSFTADPAGTQAAIRAAVELPDDAQAAYAYASAAARMRGSLVPDLAAQQTVLDLLAAAGQAEADGFPAGDLLDDSYAADALGG
ncbi:ABC transporter substrate-binding protein [Spirilliplanes yamanashiensis]|nr:ABC transporter substrate-binding protein [Spirilliplanes yamanashiensis]MDP9818828.1 ABC-type nitrate/sulfonate/bicarbonate transport system substrate-binding protein [Spirilliplanes yamanashiensis]